MQFGLSGNMTMQRAWDARGMLRDESRIETPDWNMRGTMAMASPGPNQRGTQLFHKAFEGEEGWEGGGVGGTLSATQRTKTLD